MKGGSQGSRESYVMRMRHDWRPFSANFTEMSFKLKDVSSESVE